MQDAVALLRGMNVGGHRITNDRLVEVIEGLGITCVTAYQASGNVLFHSAGQTAVAIEELLEQGLSGSLAYPVPTIVRTADELQNLLATRLFENLTVQPSGKRQIAFFKKAPTLAAIASIETFVPPNDQLLVIGREAHWWPNGGVSDSEIDWVEIHERHGPLTMRTRGTVERIAQKLLP